MYPTAPMAPGALPPQFLAVPAINTNIRTSFVPPQAPQPVRRATLVDPQTAPSTAPGPPPADTYPCGCHFPGDHKPDCMWSLWEQMQSNYIQTKKLMSTFMSNVNSIQGPGGARAGQVSCECPPGCHGRDLGEAMGLRQMRGVTVPWCPTPTAPCPTLAGTSPGYPVESGARRMMEEQRRIKGMWVQFLNIFDMALDLANDVSKERSEAAKRRKERARLERLRRLSEQQQEPEGRPSTEDKKDGKIEVGKNESTHEPPPKTREHEIEKNKPTQEPPQKKRVDEIEKGEPNQEPPPKISVDEIEKGEPTQEPPPKISVDEIEKGEPTQEPPPIEIVDEREKNEPTQEPPPKKEEQSDEVEAEGGYKEPAMAANEVIETSSEPPPPAEKKEKIDWD